jgi:hypothetical protein
MTGHHEMKHRDGHQSKPNASTNPVSEHGQALKRIDGQYLLAEIGKVLNFEKGLLYTVRELLIRPRESVRHFLHKDRSQLVKPILFTIICSLIYTILQQAIGFEDGYINYSFDKSPITTAMFTWIAKNYGYSNILVSFFIALWIRVLFRKNGYNLFEILVLLCFVIGAGMLVFTFFGITDKLISFQIIDKGYLIGILYISWGTGDFFEGNKWLNAAKGFVSYMLGLVSFTLTILSLGAFLDLISK